MFTLRGGGSGCTGYAVCATAHPLFCQMAFFISFQRKKEFWKSVKIGWDRDKNVICAPTFEKLPPPLNNDFFCMKNYIIYLNFTSISASCISKVSFIYKGYVERLDGYQSKINLADLAQQRAVARNYHFFLYFESKWRK